MRILHLLNHTLLWNGHVNVAVDLACIQSRLGHQVCLASGAGDFGQVLAAEGVEFVEIDQTRRPLTLLRALILLRQLVRDFKPDVIHSHMVTSTLLAYALQRFVEVPHVTTVHNEFQRGAILMKLGDRVVAVSGSVAESMQKRGVPKEKLRVVLNGTMGSPRVSATPPEPETLSHPAITFVGGLHPRKGLDDLIPAFRQTLEKVPNATLYLVGEGPYEQIYRDLATKLGCADRIVFCGTRADPRSYLLATDIFVLPSLADPASLVLSEARECACAIVATDVDGTREMLNEGKSGLLVPPRHPDLLAQAFETILENPGMQVVMRARAREGIDQMRVERVARDYVTVYSEVVGSPSAR